MVVLEIDNLNYKYPAVKEKKTFSLRNIDLSINDGLFFSILGPNGSGKSTLLKIIAGLIKPDQGVLKIHGKKAEEFTHKELAKIITYVPQSTFSLFPFSVYEIVMMGRTPYLNFLGYEKKEDVKIVEDVLNIFEISHLRNKGINEISGGEAQRAFLARALVQQPAILLLDEPNAHLDIKHQIAVFNILKDLKNDRNISIIFVSHDLNLAGYYSDSALLLKNGEIFLNADKQTIFSEANIKEVFDISSIVKNNYVNNSVSISIIPE